MGTGNAQDLEDGELQPVDAVMLKAQRGVILIRATAGFASRQLHLNCIPTTAGPEFPCQLALCGLKCGALVQVASSSSGTLSAA